MTTNKTFDLTADLVERAARDMLAISTDRKTFSMPDMVWLLVRTVTTGRQVGGIVLYDDELTEARQRLGTLLDVAVAGGWRGMDLLDTLMAKGAANERLEALARKAGAYCDNRHDLLDALFKEHFGDDVAQCVERRTSDAPRPQALPPIQPAMKLRRPMHEHFKERTNEHGERFYEMTAEATLLMSAQTGHDPKESIDCGDGGAAARKLVNGVLKAAAQAGYSRTEALRQILSSGPYGVETMAAIEHLSGECGAGVIARGMRDAGFNIGGA
ncbi:hypothetical protein Lcho_2187 [Leptothrix cholodnii SP-6]|uniref:Uncharacterized protein n=1 Tax=Leptothrix cholodnii (strain ATCC 51168 / LMG 8142 / SP-6) TaxID=395495 RepID=B1Y3C5_LEPCP|nr:hypothetical protein [Leptothrix cholodnii]ACB34453.1 hypothetical protein Lcho_2187 [Leptothrix cholodnii SP-6]